jgi:hypothetical protein
VSEHDSVVDNVAEPPLAWFKCEDWTDDDEPVGPAWLVAEDGSAADLGWLTLSEARALARQKRWHLREDVHDYGSASPSDV